MKTNYLKLFLVFLFCISIVNTESQGLKGVLNKAKSAVGDVGTKISGDKNVNNTSKSTIAKAVAPDVKNSVSEIRALTGLTKAAFEKKVKGMGFVEAVDQTGLFGGGTYYKSNSKGYVITIRMGSRGEVPTTLEVSRISFKKKADLRAMKMNFLDFGKQCIDLKAEFTYAKIDEKGKILGGVGAKNLANRSSKFLPALDKIIDSKKEFFVSDDYEEQDYTYRIIFYNIIADGSAMLQITIVDKTVDSLEG